MELGFLLHPSHSKVPIIYSERRLDYKVATDPVQGAAVLIESAKKSGVKPPSALAPAFVVAT